MKKDVDFNSAASPYLLRRCAKCHDLPLLYFDEYMRGWDCVHICGDRMFGVVNQPTRATAVAEWNLLVGASIYSMSNAEIEAALHEAGINLEPAIAKLHAMIEAKKKELGA